MSNVVQIAHALIGKQIFMVDLAEAIHGALERYNASGALFQQVRLTFQGPRIVHLESEFELDIPVEKKRTLKRRRETAPTRPVYGLGAAAAREALRKEIVEFFSSHFAFEEELELHVSKPPCGHFCRYDKATRRWFHMLFLQMASDTAEEPLYGVLAVVEDEANGRICRVLKDIELDAESALKEQFVTYRNFSDIGTLDGVTWHSPSNGHDIDRLILFSIFLNSNMKSNSFVSMTVLKDCWGRALDHGSRKTDLPWECGEPPGAGVSTVTISLDLRKSTSLMEQAENRPAFAVWLESLSEICREITHDNNGIFDKFTGDGIIAHFVNSAAEGPMDETSPQSIFRAFGCSYELVRAIDIHLDALRPYLRFNIAAARPSVGMAFDDAAWSLDRDGRPIVVGKGVVNACRLNGGEAGTIRMAYNMKRHLKDQVLDEVYDGIESALVDDHKDLKPELKPECYRVSHTRFELGRSREELAKLVASISAQVQQGHDNRNRLLSID